MYAEMKLRQYACADCGIPCKSTFPNAERCRKCARLRQNRKSREYQQRCWPAGGQLAIRLTLDVESQLRLSHEERRRSGAIDPAGTSPTGILINT